MAYFFPNEYILLANSAASGSASIAFTSQFTSAYSIYHVKIRNLVPATNNTILNLTFSTNSGSTYLSTAYNYSIFQLNSNGSYAQSATANTSVISLAINNSSLGSHGLNSDIYLYNLTDGTFIKNVLHNSCIYDKAAENFQYQCSGSGSHNAVTAVNAIKFAMSSGNITSGSFYLYGVNE